ncbi:MAG: formate dehydrogenase accessory sulfurtransferase FdhD [Myxococcota bacterium]|nr:formate dehydrogenase accessory sulfurtransferase FdhD [Myxococcota bacterium]
MNDSTSDGVRAVQLGRESGVVDDQLVIEEPLQIRVNGSDIAVLLRTPGTSPKEDHALVAGFLATEGVIDGADDLRLVEHCRSTKHGVEGNVVRVVLAMGNRQGARRLRAATRSLVVGGSCGLCGKTTIDDVFTKTEPHQDWLTLAPDLVVDLAHRLRAYQPRFSQSGGCHGAGLFTQTGTMLESAEDVGRHNAVDKVIGYALLNQRLPLDDPILVVSSRAGFEIVQKALMARCRAVIAIGAASHLAHRLAQRSRIALYSFVRGGDFNDHQPPAMA